MMSSGSGSVNKNWKQLGEDAWKRSDKVNGDLFTLTYGALVAQLLRDLEDPTEVNAQLEKMGYSIGTRIIDEFLAKNPIRCTNFRETGEVVRVAFRQFLGQQVNVEGDEKEWTISMENDGLGGEMVELPEVAVKGELHYANILCGVVRGALEMVNMQVECAIVNDPLLNPAVSTTDIKVKMIKYVEEELPPHD